MGAKSYQGRGGGTTRAPGVGDLIFLKNNPMQSRFGRPRTHGAAFVPLPRCPVLKALRPRDAAKRSVVDDPKQSLIVWLCRS
jgi:hypothetical protein